MDKIKDINLEETFSLAVQNHQNNNIHDAQNYYQKVLEIDPEHESANNNLGVLFQSMGDFHKAKDCFEKAIKINPNYADAHYNFGNILKELEEHQKAISCYEKAIELNPKDRKAHYNLGAVFHILGQDQKAINYYKKTIEIDPTHAKANNNLGLIFYNSSNFEKAKIFYKKAIELKPDYAEAYSNLGITLKELNKLEESEASFRKAIELKPDYAEAYNNLGITLKELNKLEEAEASLRKSIIFNPDFIEVIKSINIGDWGNSKYLLEKMCTIKIIDMNRNVREFIRIWCMYCHNLLIQGDIKRLTKILTKLFIIGERNQDINNLIKSFFNTVDIIKALELVELNDKILIKVSYCQYKFLTKDFVLSESLAALNIKEAPNLIVNPETTDLGWLVVRRSLALCKNKNIAREILNSLITNLELTK